MLLLCTGFFEAIRTPEGIEAYVEASAPWSHLTYFLLQLASVILAPIPSNVIALAGGLLFGTFPAFLLTFSAVLLGSLLVFLGARILGQSFVSAFVSRKLSEKYLDLLRRKRDTFLFLAFLFPYSPDDILCILAGLTEIPTRRFLMLCVTARPWGLLAACAVGSSALSLSLGWLIALGVVGVAGIFLVMKYGDGIEEKLIGRFGKSK